MHLNIQARNIIITEAINNYVKTKIKKVKEHFSQTLYAHVILEIIKKDQIAEVTLTSSNHHFHNKIVTEDLYKSIDILFDKVERQVRRYKENEHDKRKKSEPLHEHLKEIEDFKKDTSQVKVALEDIEIPVIPMSDLEAILQLKSDDKKPFLAYVNEKVEKTPALLIRSLTSDNTFHLFAFNDFWEKKEIALLEKSKVQINQISLLKPPLEFIEDAINYLEHHQQSNVRLFVSMRTKKIMFLYKKSVGNYFLVREKV